MTLFQALNDPNIDIYSDTFAKGIYGIINSISKKRRWVYSNRQEWEDIKQNVILKFYNEANLPTEGRNNVLDMIRKDRTHTSTLLYQWCGWILSNERKRQEVHRSIWLNKNTDEDGIPLEESLQDRPDSAMTEEDYRNFINEQLQELLRDKVANAQEIENCKKLLQEPPTFKTTYLW